jgi:hypothetical protein
MFAPARLGGGFGFVMATLLVAAVGRSVQRYGAGRPSDLHAWHRQALVVLAVCVGVNVRCVCSAMNTTVEPRPRALFVMLLRSFLVCLVPWSGRTSFIPTCNVRQYNYTKLSFSIKLLFHKQKDPPPGLTERGSSSKNSSNAFYNNRTCRLSILPNRPER